MADVRSVNQMLADTFEPKRQNRWYFQFAEYKVWGATAIILSELKSIIVKIS